MIASTALSFGTVAHPRTAAVSRATPIAGGLPGAICNQASVSIRSSSQRAGAKLPQQRDFVPTKPRSRQCPANSLLPWALRLPRRSRCAAVADPDSATSSAYLRQKSLPVPCPPRSSFTNRGRSEQGHHRAGQRAGVRHRPLAVDIGEAEAEGVGVVMRVVPARRRGDRHRRARLPQFARAAAPDSHASCCASAPASCAPRPACRRGCSGCRRRRPR